jgi:outer membrane protein assembly factor BamB
MKMLSLTFAAVLFSAATLTAEDWPQWLGPRGDSSWNDTGLVTKFPSDGPKIVWRSPVANGYSGPSVSGGKVFVMDYQVATGKVDANASARTKLTGKERVLCFDEKTGKELWSHGYDCTINLSFPNGPRCTPVVSGGMVFALGAEGHLSALNTADGKVIWEKELKSEYKCDSPIWGYAATPLVQGDVLYTLAGGKGSAVVALDTKTGKEIWRAMDTKDIGYAPPVWTKRDGKDELLVWHSESLNGLDPANGKVRWSQPFGTFYGMSIMAPRVTPDGIFIGGIIAKSAMVKPGDKAELVWEGTPKLALAPKNGTPIVVGEHVYGCDMDGDLRCFKSATGERLWSTLDVLSGKKVNSGTFFMARTPQQWVLFNDDGELILADLSPSGYKENARAKILSADTPSMGGRTVVWSHPAFANRCVFARNDKELICVSLAAD